MRARPDESLEFDVAVSSGGPRTVVAVSGEIDVASVPMLRAALAHARRHVRLQGEPLVLDLSAVTFLDASGLGVLAGEAWRARCGGVHLVLRRPSRAAIRSLEVTGMLDEFQIDDELDGMAVAVVA